MIGQLESCEECPKSLNYFGGQSPALHRFECMVANPPNTGLAHTLNIPQGDAKAQIYITKYFYGMGPERFLRNAAFIPLQCINDCHEMMKQK